MNKKYTILNGNVFLMDQDGNILSKEGAVLEGAVFVTDENGVRAIRNGEDVESQLKIENMNERILNDTISRYNNEIDEKLTSLASMRKKLENAKGGCYKGRLLIGIIVLLAFLALGAFVTGESFYRLDLIASSWDIISALKTVPNQFLTIVSICSIPGIIYFTYILCSYSFDKKKANRLEGKVSALQQEAMELKKERDEIKRNFEAKETENIRLQGEMHYLDGFNQTFEERVMARLSSIRELEDFKKELTAILQDQEFEKLLMNGGFKPEEVGKIKESLGKKLLMQQVDSKNGEA